MIQKKFYIFSALLIFFLLSCTSKGHFYEREADYNEIKEGNIHLILNEKTGVFSLYYLLDPQSMYYEPLFNSRYRRATYSSVIVNRVIYDLGSRYFPYRIGRHDGYPAFVFESPSLRITQAFSPVTTANSNVVNGIMINFIIQSLDTKPQSVGLRMLIDTMLGERVGNDHFITDTMYINNETIIRDTDSERYWISRGRNVSLMGSITSPIDQFAKVPDSVHFANWRRLNDSRWRLRTVNRRSFLGDSAVSYLFEPDILEPGSTLTYTIFLTSEDIEWYNMAGQTDSQNVQIPVIDWDFIDETEVISRDIDFSALFAAQGLLNQFINGEIDLSEQDLLEIETIINRYRDLMQ